MTQGRVRLRAIVLGSAAGGGVPQWNCRCLVCELARSGDPRVPVRTQAGLAVSADGGHWLLVCASPDLRQQLQQTPALAPRALRDSPVFGVVLLNAEIDGIAGLLTLRERQPFSLFAPAPILAELARNPVFDVLDPALVTRHAVAPDAALDIGFGLHLTLLPMPGKPPLYREPRAPAPPPAESVPTEPVPAEPPPAEPVYAALLQAGARRMLVAPACAELTAAVRDRVGSSDVVFFDGTVFTDTEMQAAGVGGKTGRRMGHVPLDGPDGTLAMLGGLPNRRILLHINNTNPVLIADSPERRQAEAAGVAIAHDGMEVWCD